jgi:DNA-binding response OmpR family regulator
MRIKRHLNVSENGTGGNGTVDVHVRRLRSKIENSTPTFIETLRNIGYRFKIV